MGKTVYEESAKMHRVVQGKLEVEPTVACCSQESLSLVYTPGVAEPCRIISKDKSEIYNYTWKGKVVAVVTDGTAVLGLGDIGPEASLPVMEGKAVLLKAFGGVNAVPIPLDTKDPQEIISTVQAIAPGFGAICLEDISAPRCVLIERELRGKLNIPVFHDDQHGTAIVVSAAMINAAKVVKKELKDMTVVVSGTGAAGSAIIKMLYNIGIDRIYGFNINGIITEEDYESYDFLTRELSHITNPKNERLTLAEAMERADAFVGVSAPNIVTKEMVASMKRDPIVFAMANPTPEISYEDAISAGAKVVGTGRSDYPNQVNNVLAFPGVFRGALQCRTRAITEPMKTAAAKALASLVGDELSEYYVLPKPFDSRVAPAVAEAVIEQAKIQGMTRI